MSKVLRSEHLKTKNQKDTKVLRSDTTANKNTLEKKATSSSKSIKPSTQLHDIQTNKEEKEKIKTKLTSRSTGASTKANLSIQKTQISQTRTGGNIKLQKNNLNTRKSNSSTTQQKQQPLRAKPLTTTKVIRESKQSLATSKTNTKKPVPTKPNAVLDTPQNVTISSPPPKKKNNSNVELEESKSESRNVNCKLIRKGSRTLAPEEIVILKRESAKKRFEEKIQQDNLQRQQSSVALLKEPVAFEVKFEDKGKKSRCERSVTREKPEEEDREKVPTEITEESQGSTNEDKEKSARERSRSRTISVTDKNYEEQQYSDDFESYESDFETESNTQSLATTEISSSGSEDVSDEIENQTDSLKQLTSDESEEDEDDSEVTQNPITVIQRDKERKLDSGHYELNSRKSNVPKTSELSITDSLEAFSLGISDQLDSGISTYAPPMSSSFNKANLEIFYGGYKDFNTKPIINQRGFDLMSKIQFDILSFTLLDLKPISYDIFMQTFGKLNTNQSSTQTQSNQMNIEQQTELQETRSIWTQHPPQFDLEIIKYLDNNGAISNQNCCGELFDETEIQSPTECELEQSLFSLKKLNNQSSQRNHQNYQKRLRKSVNYENLNSFLLRSSIALDQLLGSSNTNNNNTSNRHLPYESDPILSQVSDRHFSIETNFLNTLKVIKIFSNNKYNLLITVHESLPDTNVYSSDFTHLLMVWCTNACDKPVRLLTTWSQVSKVEISNDSSDIIVAALRDGSIALWDLRETHSFCSKLDGYLTHFAATQSLIPTWNGFKNESKLMIDLGACLDVKSFRSQTNNFLIQTATFSKTQFVSLHDSGIVTVWTLVETSETSLNLVQMKKYEKPKYFAKFSQTFEYTSPWARVKLMQSTIVNIKDYLETKSQQFQSRFDKTKQFFQKDIYSDEALKELHECGFDVGQQGLRFTSLECGSENLFICTNRNYILMCSKTLKMDKLKRVVINESRFLFPTALKVLSNENFIAVGLSNGAVMILNCQVNRARQNMDTTKTSLSSRDAVPPSRDSFLDINPTTGKSCAIQNIVLNSQKSYEDMEFEQEYRPNTAAFIALIETKQKPFELRIFDQQTIMSGSVLRKNLIQSLELSSDGWHLFALANGHIRIYDFYLDKEIDYEESQECGKIIDIATGKCGTKEKILMILKLHKQVEVHILNK